MHFARYWKPALRQATRTIFSGFLVCSPLSLPVSATAEPTGSAGDLLARANQQVERLDFTGAMRTLREVQADNPESIEAYLATARLHLLQRRPSLAQTAFSSALQLAGSDPDILAEKGQAWLVWGEPDRALEDLKKALDISPNHTSALNAQSIALDAKGLPEDAEKTRLLLAEMQRSQHPPPEPPRAPEPEPAQSTGTTEIVAEPKPSHFNPALLMDEAFLVLEGDPNAPNELVFVHAAPMLSNDFDTIDETSLYRAIDAGLIKVVNLFTYTGSDAAVWGNLALICAGSDGFASISSALRSETGQTILTDVENGGSAEALRHFLAGAYSAAGLAPETLETCVFDRQHAVRYLAQWHRAYETQGWDGGNLYETAPSLVLNTAPISSANFATWLSAQEALGQAGAPPAADQLAPTASHEVSTAPEAVVPNTDETVLSDAAANALLQIPILEAPNAPPEGTPKDVASGQLQPQANPDTWFKAGYPTEISDARLPTLLRGIWATSVAGCARYDSTMEKASRLDQAIPEMSKFGTAPFQTILLTSRAIDLRNAAGTLCALFQTDGRDASFQALYQCQSPLTPTARTELALKRIASNDAPARVSAKLGAGAPIELIQCRTLGQVSTRFASLWLLDRETCTASAPTDGGALQFHIDTEGHLTVSLQEAGSNAPPENRLVRAAIDGQVLDTDGASNRLGEFDSVSGAIAKGMFLDVLFQTDAARKNLSLPLLGSGRAMQQIVTCQEGKAPQ